MKSGIFPWFEPPPAGAPKRYDGWVWDPSIKEWVGSDVSMISLTVEEKRQPKPQRPPGPEILPKVKGWEWDPTTRKWLSLPMPTTIQAVGEVRPPMPKLPAAHPGVGEVLGWKFDFDTMTWKKAGMPVTLVEVTEERPPKPEYPPGPALTMKVKGWSWDRNTLQWIQVLVAKEIVEFEPPRSFSPTVDLAAVNMVYPMTEQFAHFQASLLNLGLTQTDANRIGQTMVDGFWNMSRSAMTKHRAELYAESFQPAVVANRDLIEKIGVYGAVIALAAIVGALIGTILSRLILPDPQAIGLAPQVTTYLLGPDRWYYGRHIATSAKGKNYYSCCDEIGTDYYRHKRGPFGSTYDVIDFPGGFLEEGWHAGKFVKYTWTQWNIEYCGFLVRINDGMFMLKTAPLVTGALPFIVWQLPESEWCGNFRLYL